MNPDQADSDGDKIGDACDAPDSTPTVTPPPPAETEPSADAEPAVKGFNAKVVRYNGGAFVQLNSDRWVENKSFGAFNYREINRDEWSVYLRNEENGEEVRLDLHRMEVVQTRRPQSKVSNLLYTITGVNPNDVDGYSVSRATYTGGAFVQLDKALWTENTDDGKSFIFEQIARDEYTVTMFNGDRNMQIVLDLFSYEIYFDQGRGEFKLGNINSINPAAFDALSVREVSNFYARFVHVDKDTWLETLGNGSQHTHTETRRDAGAVYLTDSLRGVDIRLDLAGRRIVFNDDNETYRGVVNSSQPADVLEQDGPVAWYTFDKGMLNDFSGQGHHLLSPTDLAYIPEGAREDAFYFETKSSAARVPQGVIGKLDDFTIATFVKLDDLEESVRIFDFGDDQSNYMYLTPRHKDTGKARFGIRSAGGSEQIIDADKSVLARVNGFNLQVAMYGAGAFIKLNDTEWVHNHRDTSYYFEVEFKTETAVHLVDHSRGISWRLDLKRMKVFDDTRPVVDDLYTLTSVQPEEINGYAASNIHHQNGRFYLQSGRRWIEDSGKDSFEYVELRRDESSVYLFDIHRNVGIQLDLLNKVINYEDENGSFPLYAITSTQPKRRDANWIHVAVTKSGNVGTLYINGAVAGTTANMTTSPSDLGDTALNWLGHSQFDAYSGFQGALDDFRIYNRALTLRQLRQLAAPDPSLITFMGNDVQMTPEELNAALAAKGLALVNSNKLNKDECTLLYSNADAEDLSAEIGMVACAIDLGNGDATMEYQVIYGGCDVARHDHDFGFGERCSVGVFDEDIIVHLSDSPPIDETFSFAGLTAEECSGLSRENACYGASADLAAIGVGFNSGAGTGIEAGVSIGAGFGGDFSASEGVYSGTISVKFVVGFSVTLSIAEDDVLAIYNLAETAWLENEDEIIAVGGEALLALEQFGNEVHVVGNDAVGVLQVNGETVIGYIEDTGQDVQSIYNDFERALPATIRDVEDGLIDTAGVVARGTVEGSSSIVTFVGQTVNRIGDCLADFSSCF